MNTTVNRAIFLLLIPVAILLHGRATATYFYRGSSAAAAKEGSYLPTKFGSNDTIDDLGLLKIMRYSHRKIASGYMAKIGEFPSFVTYKLQCSGMQFECNGVIIDARTILTVAHCLDFKAIDAVFVSLGIQGFKKWKTSDDNIYQAENLCKSPKYSEKPLIFDFGILLLDRPIKFSSTVQPVALPKRAIGSNEQAYVVGTGKVDENYKHLPDSAKVLPVKEVICEPKGVHESHICFRANDDRYKGDACQGDSGGPVYADIDGQQYVYGLTSYGPTACTDGTVNTGIYADVHRQVDHIRALTDQCKVHGR